MSNHGTTYRNLLIAAAEVRYLAGQDEEGEARWRKLTLATTIEKLASTVAPNETIEEGSQRGQVLRLVHPNSD